jgi:hypothetical protein
LSWAGCVATMALWSIPVRDAGVITSQ